MIAESWRQLLGEITASDPVKALAGRLRFERVANAVIHLSSRESITKSALDKLSTAICTYTKQRTTIVVRNPDTGLSLRSYSDHAFEGRKKK